MTKLVIKYGYIFQLILNHPQANTVTEFRYIKCAPNHFVPRIKHSLSVFMKLIS